MRILGCIVKSVMTLAALAVIAILLGAALPDSPAATRLVGTLAMVFALGWITLTIWWLLRLRPPRPKPRRELRTSPAPVSRWIRIPLTVLCVPVILGFVVMLYQNGLSDTVLIGAIVGPTIAVLVHRRHLRKGAVPGGQE
ncbi:MAG: DUF4153 domain-containing protein [Pseudonocardiaceae bacterium]